MLNIGKVNMLGRYGQFPIRGFWTSQARLQLLHAKCRYVRERFTSEDRPAFNMCAYNLHFLGLAFLQHLLR